ncbi:hypothetical protein ABZ806_15600 [Spirillospora sp. NPDC047418]
MGVVGRVDAYQRRHHWAGLPLAVVYKFVDDQGAYLTALITYYGFVSLFPLLLLLVTVLGCALQGNPELQQRVLDSALAHTTPVARARMLPWKEWMFTPIWSPRTGLAQVRTGAVTAALVRQIIQWAGAFLLGHVLKDASATYGMFGIVLGLLTPFTDNVELTAGDRRAYTSYAETERHKGFENVDVEFDPPRRDD